jgi:hypothetical protein
LNHELELDFLIVKVALVGGLRPQQPTSAVVISVFYVVVKLEGVKLGGYIAKFIMFHSSSF